MVYSGSERISLFITCKLLVDSWFYFGVELAFLGVWYGAIFRPHRETMKIGSQEKNVNSIVKTLYTIYTIYINE